MWYKPYCSPLASSIFRSLSAPALCRKWTPQCHPNAALAGPSTEAHSWCWITGDTFPVPIISHNHGSLEVENGYYPILSKISFLSFLGETPFKMGFQWIVLDQWKTAFSPNSYFTGTAGMFGSRFYCASMSTIFYDTKSDFTRVCHS